MAGRRGMRPLAAGPLAERLRTMRNQKTLAILALAGSALVMTGASAQQPAPQATQAMPCPPGGPTGHEHGPAPAMGPGAGQAMGQGVGQGPMAGSGGMMAGPGGMMGMDRQEMQQMHADMAAMREEMRQLR